MKTVKEILGDKRRELCAAGPDWSVYDAIRLMAEQDVGAIIVVDLGRLVGIISERDYTRKVVLRGRSSKETLVHEIMSTNVITAAPDQSADECLATMARFQVRHMPVASNGTIHGVISILDLAQSMIEDQRFTIRQLEGYIAGVGD